MFYAAIVGSRRRTDKSRVDMLVCKLHMSYGYLTIVSGGCPGPDTWAAEVARAIGIPVIEHRPTLPEAGAPAWAYTRAYYARNKVIAGMCHELFAFVSPDRTGGTENTIKYAIKFRKRVTIIMPDGTREIIEPKPVQLQLA